MFSSSSRKERERAQGRLPPIRHLPSSTRASGRPAGSRSRRSAAGNVRGCVAQTGAHVGTLAGRTAGASGAAGRRRPTFAETNPVASAARSPGTARAQLDEPSVTVLKSGVVDGMAYSLYSDGSIEAQMPEGMMRFASIDDFAPISTSVRDGSICFNLPNRA